MATFAEEYCANLEYRDITLYLDNTGTLRCKSLVGELTTQDITLIKSNRAKIVKFLDSPQSQEYRARTRYQRETKSRHARSTRAYKTPRLIVAYVDRCLDE